VTTTTLFLEPIDAWSFRDGRPFDAGESFEARSLFPPSPWSTLGCLRTALLRRHCGDPERYAGRPGSATCPRCGLGPCEAIGVVGSPSQAPPFSVGPPLPARRIAGARVEVLYPTPADLVLHAGQDEGASHVPRLLAPLDVPAGAAHSLAARALTPMGLAAPGRFEPFGLPGSSGFPVASPVAWLNASELSQALDGVPPSIASPDGRRFADEEPRIGVGMDNALGSVRQGLLYMRNVVRLRDGYGLAVTLDRDVGLGGDIARLGGDGRLVRVERVDAAKAPIALRASGPRVKVYLAAPTWFEAGDRPGWLASGKGQWPDCGVRVRLVASALTRMQPTGGWDLVRQQPRPMRPMVGPGSVLFFEVFGGDDPSALVQAVHGRPLCDDADMARAGFGLAFAGRW
jgi:CRISPR-associated protein Cmr3